MPRIRASFGPRETFYLVFAAVAGVGLLVLTVRDAAEGVVGAPAVGLVVVSGLAFLVIFGGSDREQRGEGGPLDPGEESPPTEPGAPRSDPGAERGDGAHQGEG